MSTSVIIVGVEEVVKAVDTVVRDVVIVSVDVIEVGETMCWCKEKVCNGALYLRVDSFGSPSKSILKSPSTMKTSNKHQLKDSQNSPTISAFQQIVSPDYRVLLRGRVSLCI